MADPTEVDEQEDDHTESSVVKTLRAENKRLKKDAEDAPKLRLQLALTKGKLDTLNEKQVKALLAAHDGEIEPEALKATATELGFGQAPEPTGEETPESAEVDGELAHLSNFAGAPAPEGREVLTQEKVDEKIASLGPDEIDDWMYANKHLFGIS